jgi:hypothetical protein
MIDLTYFEAVGLLLLSPVAMYYCYWRGWSNGKREGYMTGRAVSRHPVNNDR